MNERRLINMDKTHLSQLIEEGLTIRAIAQKTDKAYSTVRYWLTKYEMETIYKKGKSPLCQVCGETNPKNFYFADSSRTRTRLQYCKRCDNTRAAALMKNNKVRAVELKGGKCVHCGFSIWVEALDFHHLDPAQKDANFNSWTGWGWNRIELELENCILLCRNCHAGVHAGHISVHAVGFEPTHSGV